KLRFEQRWRRGRCKFPLLPPGESRVLRFRNPEPLQGGTMAWVAGIGIVINAVSALLFFKNKNDELNAKSAYLHLLTDALVSAGVVVAGVIIYYTHIYWIDPLMSLVIMAVVLVSTWGLLRESLQLSMDAVPKNVDVEKVKEMILKTDGVTGLDHIHIWAISTTKNAMTAHLTLENNLEITQIKQLKKHLKHELEHLNIEHATLETEHANN
ncbi:MAG: cation transporter, partial [Sphingobacteriales bacterium]